MSVAGNAPFMAAAATELAPLHAKLNERARSQKRSHSQKIQTYQSLMSQFCCPEASRRNANR
jgi:hypothetical protein